jgi:glutamate-ammonia-ligase adenylyltransferase
LLAPSVPRLLAALAQAPDPDMALNNLERHAAVVDRSVLYATLAQHPGALDLLVRVSGSSQFLADALRRRPQALAWLLEPRTMRVWLPEDLAADLAQALAPFETREARMRALRRVKYRHLLRIGARDLLGDADLTVTTSELAHLADACLAEALASAEAAARVAYGAPLDATGAETGLAVIAMGKLGGEELNYSSDIDLMFVYGADGETVGGRDGRVANGEYFARVCRGVVTFLEEVTDEGYAFRVDLRLRPEGRMGAVVLALDRYRDYYRDRAELWERQALVKARVAAGDLRVGTRFIEEAREVVYRPGLDARILPAIRAMKTQIDRTLDATGGAATNVKLGRGGIREVEFLVQALQLLYGGDDAWLRERNTLKAIFRLTERGYLAPDLGRRLSEAYVHLRTVEHRLQILHEFQTHTLPSSPRELGRLARRVGFGGPPASAARAFQRRHHQITTSVHRAFRAFFGAGAARPVDSVGGPTQARPGSGPPTPSRQGAARPVDSVGGPTQARPGSGLRKARRGSVRLPSVMALRATGFADPERARHNLGRILEGRPLVPYAGRLRAALERLYPTLLDALWKSPDPDEALNQVERFLSAAGPRAGLVELLADRAELLTGLVRVCAGGDLLTQLLIAQPELLASLAEPERLLRPKARPAYRAAVAQVFAPGLGSGERRDRLRRLKQAEELTIVWRYLSGVTTIEGYAREMTALAEAVLAAGWLLALEPLVLRHGAPRDAQGRFIPAVVVGLGKLGGRELSTGSDLDLFVVTADEGRTDGADPIDASWFYSLLAERVAGALGDITAAGVAFPVDLRLRPGSKGSGFASSVAALERYYAEYGDLWERQTLTRARLVLGDPALARRVRAALRRVVYGTPLPRAQLKEIAEVRKRMEVELGRETRGRAHVKYGRGGLVDVEFLAQALQLVHGGDRVEARAPATVGALRGLARAGALPPTRAAELADHYRFLRRVSAALRLLGARPSDTLELAGPMPARVASALGFPSRAAFLDAYGVRRDAVRAAYLASIQGAGEGASLTRPLP